MFIIVTSSQQAIRSDKSMNENIVKNDLHLLAYKDLLTHSGICGANFYRMNFEILGVSDSFALLCLLTGCSKAIFSGKYTQRLISFKVVLLMREQLVH